METEVKGLKELKEEAVGCGLDYEGLQSPISLGLYHILVTSLCTPPMDIGSQRSSKQCPLPSPLWMDLNPPTRIKVMAVFFSPWFFNSKMNMIMVLTLSNGAKEPMGMILYKVREMVSVGGGA